MAMSQPHDAPISSTNLGTSISRMHPVLSLLDLQRTIPGDLDRDAEGRLVYDCDICHKSGWVKVPDAQGPIFGGYRLVRCGCQKYARYDLMRLQRASSLVDEMDKLTFATFDPSAQPEAYRAACAFVGYDPEQPTATRTTRGWMVLWGPFGNGKTHLLAAMAQHLQANGVAALYVKVPDLLAFLRDGIAAKQAETKWSVEDRLDLIKHIKVLFLDDLGAENDTEWAREQLYRILDARYDARLGTCIATNLNPDDLPGRLSDRMQDAALAKVVMLKNSYTVARADTPAVSEIKSYRRKPRTARKGGKA